MNTFSNQLHKPIDWPTIILVTLGLWLSSSLLLDLLILPGLSASGMMSLTGFASAGYLIFGIFNHLELLAAAIVLTGFLALYRYHSVHPAQDGWAIAFSGILMAIALTYTYLLTPHMSGLGMQLNLFESTGMPASMISLHEGYWGLELIKFALGITLWRWCYHTHQA